MRVSIEWVSIIGGKRIDAADSVDLTAVGGRSHSRRGNVGGRTAERQRCGVTIADSSGRFKLKASKGRLIVVAEPDMPGGVEAGTRAADWIAEEYGNDPSQSIVTSLKHALGAVHRRLGKENRNSLSSDRRSAAVGCAVLRDRDIYLAQVGPILAIRLRDGELSLIGQEFSPGPIPFASCVGQDCTIEPNFSRESLRQGDVIVICTPGLMQIGDEPDLTECLGRGNSVAIVEALFDLNEASHNPVDFTALVIEVEANRPSERRANRLASGTFEREELENSPRRLSQRQQANHESGHAGGRLRSEAWRRTSDLERSRMKPHRNSRRFDIKRIGFFAVVPMLIMSALWIGGSVLVGDLQTNAPGGPIFADIEGKEQKAQATQDVTLKMSLLSQANELAAQASSDRPDDPNLAMLHQRIRGELDQLSATAGLPAARRIIDLSQDDRASDPSRMMINGTDLYVLDSTNSKIRRYQFDQSGEQIQPSQHQIIASGQDKANGITIGQVVGMAWVPAGGQRERPTVVFANESGGLFQYDPRDGVSTLKGPSQNWVGAIQAMGGYAGSLYVLSPKGRRLVWYQSSAQGYEKAPFNYINPDAQVEMADAVDFAVDSSLYLLHATGKIERFEAGKLQPFDSSTPDGPLNGPVSIYSSPAVSSVYVVDAGNQRIVQYSRDGHYEWQFRYNGPKNGFNNVKGVSVDDERRKIYVLADKKVFVADLPR